MIERRACFLLWCVSDGTQIVVDPFLVSISSLFRLQEQVHQFCHRGSEGHYPNFVWRLVLRWTVEVTASPRVEWLRLLRQNRAIHLFNRSNHNENDIALTSSLLRLSTWLFEAQVPTLILLPSLHTAMRAIVLVLAVPLGTLAFCDFVILKPLSGRLILWQHISYDVLSLSDLPSTKMGFCFDRLCGWSGFLAMEFAECAQDISLRRTQDVLYNQFLHWADCSCRKTSFINFLLCRPVKWGFLTCVVSSVVPFLQKLQKCSCQGSIWREQLGPKGRCKDIWSHAGWTVTQLKRHQILQWFHTPQAMVPWPHRCSMVRNLTAGKTLCFSVCIQHSDHGHKGCLF